MSEPQQNSGCVKFILAALAVGAGLWLLQKVYTVGLAVGFDAVLALDASAYGRLLAPAAWPGYTLLGLGLGGAAGAVAAQRRFRLTPGIAWGAAALGLALLALVGYGNAAADTLAVLERTTTTETTTTAADETAVTLPADAAIPTETAAYLAPDTTSQPADGWMQVAVQSAPLRTDWTDSTAAPVDYLQPDDWVRVLRRVRHWALVQGPADRLAVGWMRTQALANLRLSAPPLAAAASKTTETDEPAEAPEATNPAPAEAAAAAAMSATAPAWPTGHREYTGQTGNFHARYALDWQPNGELSGTYRLDEQPGLVLRLTGAPAADGALHLAEFTRGKLTARCVLQRQGEGFAGTMFNTDGRQFEMTLDAE